MMFNEKEIRKTIAVLKPNGKLFEVRIINDSKKIVSGYFSNADTLIAELKKQTVKEGNVYITLNEINKACYDRTQKDKFAMYSKATTSDNDIVGYDFLMVDLDPVRPTGTSSSNEELQLCKNKSNDIFSFLRNLGFEKPIIAESGNGVHLLYAVRLSNNKEREDLLKNCLGALNILFTDDRVGVDVKNYNPARITKLYGTISKKGSNTKERPHRESRILGEYGELKPTDICYLKKLADYLPKQDKPKKYNNYRPSEFDLREWLDKHGLRYRIDGSSGSTKYILDQCPFDSNHKGKDAVIFQGSDGAIGFHCFHNSCSDKKWQDVRLLFEPDAYEKKYEAYDNRQRDNYKKEEVKPIVKKENQPIFLTSNDILNSAEEEEEFILTGVSEIDKKMRGLKKGAITLISGLRASGKSSVLSEITLNVIDKGHKTAFYSGELSPKNFYRWLELQAAGKGFTEPSQYEGYFNVPKRHKKKISDWMNDKMLLFNNEYGNKYESILKEFEKLIDEQKVELIILDNLMALDIKSFSPDKYEAQKDFVTSVSAMAKKKNVHVIFVCHPRKAMGFLRLDDVSGTGDLSNMADNAFVVHRVNNDFKRLSSQMFGWKDDCDLFKATNVIEIAKNRDNGIQDYFIPLYYEPETKRLKNEISENKVYGWNDDTMAGWQIDMESENPFV